MTVNRLNTLVKEFRAFFLVFFRVFIFYFFALGSESDRYPEFRCRAYSIALLPHVCIKLSIFHKSLYTSLSIFSNMTAKQFILTRGSWHSHRLILTLIRQCRSWKGFSLTILHLACLSRDCSQYLSSMPPLVFISGGPFMVQYILRIIPNF